MYHDQDSHEQGVLSFSQDFSGVEILSWVTSFGINAVVVSTRTKSRHLSVTRGGDFTGGTDKFYL